MADLPARPSLDHLRRQARDLLRAARLLVTVERVTRAEAIEHRAQLFTWDARNRKRPALPAPLGDCGPGRHVYGR